MPLIKADLEEGLRTLLDKDYVNFEGFPPSSVEVAEKWSRIVDNYAKLVAPVSVSSPAAKAAFNSIMLGVTPLPPNGLPLLVAAFSAYATALATGMQPAFTGTPPTSPINIAPVIALGLSGASGAATAQLLAEIIHNWFKTGTAVNNTSGATSQWI